MIMVMSTHPITEFAFTPYESTELTRKYPSTYWKLQDAQLKKTASDSRQLIHSIAMPHFGTA
jgi:hypothetical protein